MRHPEKIRSRHVAAIGAACAMSAAAQASIISASDPSGYQTVASLAGGAGAARDATRWFTAEDGEARYTAWSNQKIDFHFTLDGQAANYNVGVTAKNFTGLALPPGFSQFMVNVEINDRFLDTLSIGASDDTWNTSWLNVGEQAGDVKITLNWINDSYKAGVYDANFGVGAVSISSAPQPASDVVPTPASAALMLIAFGMSATRHRRDASRSEVASY